jgi:hypothetical protein
LARPSSAKSAARDTIPWRCSGASSGAETTDQAHAQVGARGRDEANQRIVLLDAPPVAGDSDDVDIALGEGLRQRAKRRRFVVDEVGDRDDVVVHLAHVPRIEVLVGVAHVRRVQDDQVAGLDRAAFLVAGRCGKI